MMIKCHPIRFIAAVFALAAVAGCNSTQETANTAPPPANTAPAPGALMAKMSPAEKKAFAKQRMAGLQNGPGNIHGNMSVKGLSMIMSRMTPEQQRAYIAKNHLPGPGTAAPQR